MAGYCSRNELLQKIQSCSMLNMLTGLESSHKNSSMLKLMNNCWNFSGCRSVMSRPLRNERMFQVGKLILMSTSVRKWHYRE